MRVTIGDTVLIVGGERSPQDMTGSHREQVQAAPGVRTAGMPHHARGNTQTTLTFSGWSEHDDAFAAERFILEHHAALSKGGVVKITAEGRAGQHADRYLHDGKLAAHSWRQIGKSTFHNYTLVGGVLDDQTPTT